MAVLATLKETSTDTDRSLTGEEHLTIFKSNYSGPDISQYDHKLSKGLKLLSEHKKRDEIVRKLEKKNAGIERKISMNSTSARTQGVGKGESSVTLVESNYEECVEKQ
jgi:hypothetical protein